MAEFMGAGMAQPSKAPPPKWKVLPARLRKMSSKPGRPATAAATDPAPSAGASKPVSRSDPARRPRSEQETPHRPGPRGGEDYRMLTTEQAYRALYHLVEAYQ